MNQNLPQEVERENLGQLSKEELVNMIIEQSKVIRELQQEIERLKVFYINLSYKITKRAYQT